MERIKNFKELLIWQKGIVLVEEIYNVTNNYPKNEAYGLVSQIRRSAVSIPSNIAEGFKRRHSKEFKQFINIALGSAAELETQIIISKQLGFIKEEQYDPILENIITLSKMMNSLAAKIK